MMYYCYYYFRIGEIMLQSDFLSTIPSQNQSWASWTVSYVVKPSVSWAFGKLKNSLLTPPANIDFEATYVHFGVLQVFYVLL